MGYNYALRGDPRVEPEGDDKGGGAVIIIGQKLS